MTYLVNWYLDLSGQEILTYQEIKAWAELCNVPVEPWEVDVLRQLDRIARKVRNVRPSL